MKIQIVSSDVIGMKIRFTLRCNSDNGFQDRLTTPIEVQVVSWYDNENSYTSQMVRTIKYFAELG